MSMWGKYLAQIVVPSGGWDFGYNHGGGGTATVAAGTYGSILEVCAALETALEVALPAHNWEVTVDEVGTVRVWMEAAWTVVWGTTDDAFSALLGYAESEAVDGSFYLTGTSQHTHGWYPGALTHNRSLTQGVGVALGVDWLTEDIATRTWSGEGDLRCVRPSKLPYRRSLTYELIGASEASDRLRGVAALRDPYLHLPLRWYPDRADGIVGTPGTQGNPSTQLDSAVDYWGVDLVAAPQIRERGARWTDVEVLLSARYP